MKEPSLSRRKIKLLCSFNGVFKPRQPSGKLRYVGGETRIVSFDRNIGILQLRLKISELCPRSGSFSLKYQLPEWNGVGGDAPLVLIETDDDVQCMIDEYDKLELEENPARLWVFVCDDNRYVGLNSGSSFSVICSETESSCLGSKVFQENNRMNRVSSGLSDPLCVNVLQNKKILVTPVNGVENSGRVFTLNPLESKNPIKYGNYTGNMMSIPESHLHSLTLNCGNSQVGINGSMQVQFGRIGKSLINVNQSLRNIQHASMVNLNRENVMPGSAHYDSINSLWDNSQRGIRNRCLYHSRNLRNYPAEVGSHRIVRLDGRSCVGKWYPGIRPCSNISKHGQATRLYHPYKEEIVGRIGSHKDPQLSFNVRSTRGILRDHIIQPIVNPNPQGKAIEDPVACTRIMTARGHLPYASSLSKHEVPLHRNFHGAPEGTSHHPTNGKFSLHDFKNKQYLMEHCKGSELGCNGSDALLNMEVQKDLEKGVKAFVNHHKIETLPGRVAYTEDLSLCNLSLSSSKEGESRARPSVASNDVVCVALLRCEMGSQPKPADLMDEEHFSSGPSIEKSNGVASSSFSKNAANFGKDLVHMEEKKQDNLSNLSIDEKVNVKESPTCSKLVDGICRDVAAFYSHLATQELQTIKNSDLEEIRELGSGTYGTVFYGKWRGSDVAIKRIKPSCFTRGELGEDRLIADFWKEAQILGQLHHPNIMAFYGVVTDGPVKNLATVTEYMVNGSLKQVLERKDRTIDRRKRLIIAMDAAFGLEYLHEKNIVHFDLKSHNFLVNMRDPQRPVCKIGDLGLSKIKQRTLVSGGVRGTIPWMAPELLSSKNKMVTEKVDVYSFGIVMWELLTGEEPYAELRSEEIIVGIIKGDLRPEVPSWCDPTWRSLMEKCWSSDPDSRPSFSEIAKELRAVSASMNIK